MANMTDILTKLIEKSRDGKIAWRDTSSKQKFLAMLGETGVAIDFDTSTDVYELQVIDKHGRVIESISAEYRPYGISVLDPDVKVADTLKELHEIARRSALNIDLTLDELASHLDAIV